MKIENSELYEEIEIDNPNCSRRFHIHFDPTSQSVSETSLKCPHCQATVITKKNHPKLILAREENLVKSPEYSKNLMHECYLQNK